MCPDRSEWYRPECPDLQVYIRPNEGKKAVLGLDVVLQQKKELCQILEMSGAITEPLGELTCCEAPMRNHTIFLQRRPPPKSSHVLLITEDTLLMPICFGGD